MQVLIKCKGPCGQEKKEDDFPLQRDKRGRRNSYCYECKRAIEKARYQAKKKNKK